MRQRSIQINVVITYQWKRKSIKQTKNPKALIDYSQIIDDVHENLQDYNQTKKRKVLIVFDGYHTRYESQ